MRRCLLLLVEDTHSFVKAVIMGLLVFIAERWIDSVVDVVKVNEQIMHVQLLSGKQILNSDSAYYVP